MNFTDQQHKALSTTTASIALSAGAGCGKTFVLTHRFLSSLARVESDDPLAKVVAFTFTDRAAREMRHRIRREVEQRLDHAPDDEIEKWINIYRGLDGARISTIHGFCSSLLRANAVELQLDPQFGVLSKPQTHVLQREAIQQTLIELLEGDDENCQEAVLGYGLEDLIETLEGLLKQRVLANPSWNKEYFEQQLAKRWWRAYREDYLPAIVRELGTTTSAQQILEFLKHEQPDHEVMTVRCNLLRDLLPSLRRIPVDEIPETLASLREATLIQGGGGKKVWSSEEAYESAKELLTKLRKDIDDTVKLTQFREDDFTAPATWTHRVWRIHTEVCNRYADLKASMRALDFDDQLAMTHSLLSNHEPARQRAQRGIEFLLVDEFQDTDPIQADIVRDLCGDQLATGKLFLVGDAKQSIYRFRRADPDLFEELSDEVPEEGRLPLSVNFRSQPEILKFVNCLFRDTFGPHTSLQPFDPTQCSPTPSIEFLFPIADHDAPDSVEDRRRQEADWIGARIASLLTDETPRIRDKDPETGETTLRRVRAGDIALLFRAMSNASLYEEALRARGIEYYVVGGRAFYAQQEVYDFINLCAALDDPDDEIALVGILRSPFFSWSDELLFRVKQQAGEIAAAIWHGNRGQNTSSPLEGRGWVRGEIEDLDKSDAEQFAFTQATLRDLRDVKDKISLSQLLNLALEKTGYDASLLWEFMGERKIANVRKLIELAREMEQAEGFGLREFVSELQQSVQAQLDEEQAATSSEDADTVQLMTIHKSKGLEFPVVIVADCDRESSFRGGRARVHREFGPLVKMPTPNEEEVPHPLLEVDTHFEKQADQAESLRVLYVATTRAKDYLILSGCLKSSGQPTGPWMKFLATRFDITTGLPQGDPYLGHQLVENLDADQLPEIQVFAEPPDDPQLNVQDETKLLSLPKAKAILETAEPTDIPASAPPIPPRSRQPLVLSVTSLTESSAPLTIEMADTEEQIGGEESSQLGTLLHATIERLAGSTENWEQVLLAEAARQNLKPDSTLVGSVKTRLEALFAHPNYQKVSQAESTYHELEFRFRWNEQVSFNGIIDLLLINDPHNFEVWDFKTGQVPAQPEDYLEKFGIQLFVYRKTLLEQFPAASIRTFIVATHQATHFVEVPWTPDTEARIEALIHTRLDEKRPAPEPNEMVTA